MWETDERRCVDGGEMPGGSDFGPEILRGMYSALSGRWGNNYVASGWFLDLCRGCLGCSSASPPYRAISREFPVTASSSPVNVITKVHYKRQHVCQNVLFDQSYNIFNVT